MFFSALCLAGQGNMLRVRLAAGRSQAATMPAMLAIAGSATIMLAMRCCRASLADGLRKRIGKRGSRRGAVIGMTAIDRRLKGWRIGDGVDPRHWGFTC